MIGKYTACPQWECGSYIIVEQEVKEYKPTSKVVTDILSIRRSLFFSDLIM